MENDFYFKIHEVLRKTVKVIDFVRDVDRSVKGAVRPSKNFRI